MFFLKQHVWQEQILKKKKLIFLFLFLHFLSNQTSKSIETKTQPSPKHQNISNPKHQNSLRAKPSKNHLIKSAHRFERNANLRETYLRDEELETFGSDFERNRVGWLEKERKHHYKSQILNVFLCKTNGFSQWLSLTFIFHAFLSLLISLEPYLSLKCCLKFQSTSLNWLKDQRVFIG